MTSEGVIAIVFIIGAILLFHEAGHFLVAKLFRMRVDEFGMGLPLKSPIVAFKRGETLYSLNWIPFGAFVRIAGMDPEEGDVERGFHTRPLWQRGLVLAAGSTMNVVLAALLFLAAGMIFGERVGLTTTIRTTVPGGAAAEAGLRSGDQMVAINDRWTSTEVADVAPGLPAAGAGLQPGDRITEVDGKRVHEFQEMVRRLDSPEKERVRVTVQRVDEADTTVTTHALLLPRLEGVDAIAEAAPHEPVPVSIEQLGLTFEPLQWSTVTGMIRNSPGQEISVTVLRQGEQLTKRMTPRTEMDDDFNPNTGELEKQPIPRIGVTPKQIYRRLAPLAAMRAGFAETALIGEAVVMGLAEMIAGEARPQVMSIVKIAVEIQEQTYQGWYWVLRIGGFISFIIGFLNILPFPPFDGWRLVYLGYEGVIGRAPDRKKEALINLVGFAVVMFAFVILVLKDVMDLVANRAVR